MAKVDWKRARKFKSSELKYEAGTMLSRTGTPSGKPEMDDLGKRAKIAEARFLREMRMNSIFDGHRRGWRK